MAICWLCFATSRWSQLWYCSDWQSARVQQSWLCSMRCGNPLSLCRCGYRDKREQDDKQEWIAAKLKKCRISSISFTRRWPIFVVFHPITKFEAEANVLIGAHTIGMFRWTFCASHIGKHIFSYWEMGNLRLPHTSFIFVIATSFDLFISGLIMGGILRHHVSVFFAGATTLWQSYFIPHPPQIKHAFSPSWTCFRQCLPCFLGEHNCDECHSNLCRNYHTPPFVNVAPFLSIFPN